MNVTKSSTDRSPLYSFSKAPFLQNNYLMVRILLVLITLINKQLYYTTSSASGQDEPNLALWLATRAGKMELSCPLGIRVMSRKEHLSCYGVLSRIINPLLTKRVRSKWLDIQPSWSHACSITHTNSPYNIVLCQAHRLRDWRKWSTLSHVSLKASCKVKKDLKTAHWNSQSKQIDVTYLKYFTE